MQHKLLNATGSRAIGKALAELAVRLCSCNRAGGAPPALRTRRNLRLPRWHSFRLPRPPVARTEQIATRTGDAIGGLLNATFGKCAGVDHRTGGAASGYLEMVRGSLIGAVLANLLLTLGLSFFLGGVCYHDQRFNASAARTYSKMMLLAAISMGVPAALGVTYAGRSLRLFTSTGHPAGSYTPLARCQGCA